MVFLVDVGGFFGVILAIVAAITCLAATIYVLTGHGKNRKKRK